MTDLNASGVEKIAELGSQADNAAFFRLLDGSEILRTFEGVQVLSDPITDPHGLKLAAPTRIKNSITIQDADSLVEYIARYKTTGTVLFADITHNAIRAVLDYHIQPDVTQHGDHVATLSLPYSEEWKIWTAKHEKREGQLDFARFLEENAADIKTPDAATILEACNDLQAKRTVSFTKAIRTHSDNESFEYIEDNDAKTKGGIPFPTRFVLGLPVYFNGRTVELGAFLRHKLTDGQLTLGIALHRAEHIRQAMFKEIVEDIATRAEVPAYYSALRS